MYEIYEVLNLYIIEMIDVEEYYVVYQILSTVETDFMVCNFVDYMNECLSKPT